MDEKLLKTLNVIVDETKKQNERMGFQNLILNLYNYGVGEGKKMANPKSIMANTLVSIINTCDTDPTKEGSYLVFDDKFRPKMVEWNNEEGWKTIMTPDKYWIDIKLLLQMKKESLAVRKDKE